MLRFLFFILNMAVFKSEEWKGYVFALVGTIAFSSLYVFSKAGLNQVELAQFGLYYFGMGFLLNLFFVLASGKFRQLPRISKKLIGLLVVLGVIDILSNITFFHGHPRHSRSFNYLISWKFVSCFHDSIGDFFSEGAVYTD